MYDEALKLAHEGHVVHLLYCDGLMSQCFLNICGNAAQCSLCKSYYQNDKCRFGKEINFIPMTSLVTAGQLQNIAVMEFDYHSVHDIKQLSYEGLNIGLGALSAYITASRNMNPLIDKTFRDFFDETLRNAVRNIIALQQAVEHFHPEHILLYNGRFADSRPVWEFAQKSGIPFTTLEAMYGINCNFKARYTESTPFSLAKTREIVDQLWQDPSFGRDYKLEVGASFFERRRKALYTGDKIYTINQEEGLLPQNWDSTKHNIVIFNSSEDEFAAVGGELEEKALFKSQLEGLRYIKAHFQGNSDVRLTLRVHPNLSQIEYSYARDITSLQDTDFDVIPGDSPISTYSLIDAADTVVIFGSTVGVEATYWGKPTILLAGATYYYLDCCYTPQSINEMLSLLTARLEPKDKENAIKFGYMLMTEHWETHSAVDFNWTLWHVKLFGKNKSLVLNNWQRLLGSPKLYAIISLIRRLGYRLFNKFKPNGGDKFVLPRKESLTVQ